MFLHRSHALALGRGLVQSRPGGLAAGWSDTPLAQGGSAPPTTPPCSRRTPAEPLLCCIAPASTTPWRMPGQADSECREGGDWQALCQSGPVKHSSGARRVTTACMCLEREALVSQYK